MLAVILTIQFEQVERIQEDLLVMAMGMELVEVRFAIPPSPDRFPVHDDGADPKGPQRIDYPGILGGPIVASARVEPDPIALTSAISR